MQEQEQEQEQEQVQEQEQEQEANPGPVPEVVPRVPDGAEGARPVRAQAPHLLAPRHRVHL